MSATPVATNRPAAAEIEPDEHARLRAFFLARLARLVELDRLSGPELPPHLRHLIRHCAYSTYLDCVALGAQADARRILGRAEPAA